MANALYGQKHWTTCILQLQELLSHIDPYLEASSTVFVLMSISVVLMGRIGALQCHLVIITYLWGNFTNRLFTMIIFYYIATLQFSELFRVTPCFTNICKARLHGKMLDFIHLYSDVKRCGSKPLAVYHMSTNCESAHSSPLGSNKRCYQVASIHF